MAPDTHHSLTEPAPLDDNAGDQPGQLVLVGAGQAHLDVMAHLAAHPIPGARITLIAPSAEQVYADMVPGWVAGHYALDACTIAVEPLVRRCGIRWLPRNIQALDASARTLTLDDDTLVHYDCLSIATGPVQNRAQVEQSLPGAREFGLFVRPLEGFCKLWPQVVELGEQRALRIAVIGTEYSGAELAMAIRCRLPDAALTLLCGPQAAANSSSGALQQRLLTQLRAMNVTVLPDVALELTQGSVRLGCGAQLACDLPVIASDAQGPAWLATSGLNLDARGFAAVDAYRRCVSHPQVFAADDDSAQHGRSLAVNLAAALAGRALPAHVRPANALKLLACGNRTAIGNWGAYTVQGRWVWWLKSLLDQRRIRRYRVDGPKG